jgi:hypothetical protein
LSFPGNLIQTVSFFLGNDKSGGFFYLRFCVNRDLYLTVNQFSYSNFLRHSPDIVHYPDLSHLILGFQFLRYILFLYQQKNQMLHHLCCLPVDFFQVVVSLPAEKKPGINPLMILAKIPQTGQYIHSLLLLCNRFPKFISGRYFGFSLDISYVSVSTGKNMAEIIPVQMLHQVMIVQKNIIKTAALRSHQQRRSPAVSPQKIAVPLFQSKQAVNRSSDLTAHVPVIERTCQHDHIALPRRRVNFIHVIPLDTGTFSAAMSAKAAFAAVNIHSVQEKFCYSMTGTFRAVGKRFDQRGGVSFSAGTAIENDNFLGHGVFLLKTSPPEPPPVYSRLS